MHRSTLVYWLGFFLLLLLSSSGYLLYERDQLQKRMAAEQASFTLQLEERTTELSTANSNIAALENTLDIIKEELEELEDDYRDEKNRNEEFEDRIKDLAGTVGDLDKLSKTDEELLQKYSKIYFLNENYIPSDLDKIKDKYVTTRADDQYFHGDAIDFLEDLLDEAEDDDIELQVVSAYRSFDEQISIKGAFTQVYGEGANTFSADQGYSEHQLGTAVDFVVPDDTELTQRFANTEAYEWLLDNAHKYGFTLSYPEGNEFYIFEPWHWRFVGVDLAKDLKRKGDNFYDWEQRKIDEYLIKIFD